MLYKYRALQGEKIISKKIEASNEEAVVTFLRNNDLIPIEIKPEKSQEFDSLTSIFNRISFDDIVNFTRQLAIMLNAGLTLIDCFAILKKQTSKTGLTELYDDIDKNIRGGNSFSNSLQAYPQYFSGLYISLIKSGEASGKLSPILQKLAENLEKQREFKGKIKGAMIYPVIVITGMIIVSFIMITFVLPSLLGLFKDLDVKLPLTTQFLVFISNFFASYWPFIIAATFIGIFVTRSYLRSTVGKRAFDSFIIKTPVIGKVITQYVLVNSTRTLSILIGSGVSILESLDIISSTTDNTIYQDAFKNIYTQVEKGTSLGQAITNQKVFPPILVQMTTVGEQTGHLDETLMRISNYFEIESEMAVKTMTTLIEPILLVTLGLGVCFLVLSIITPIYSLTNSIR